jgi:hypothetical protein
VRDGTSSVSPELSVVLSPVAHLPQGLHLCDLQRTGIPTEVIVDIGTIGRALATKRRLQGTSMRSRGPCGAPPAFVLLPAVGATSPLPQQLVW